MQLGALLPLGDIGGEPAVVREYAQTAEAIGYHFIEAPDHVLGATEASAPEPGRTGAGLYHDPFVLFGFLAGCTNKLGFSTGVLILPQRQTVLVAKQAACLDVLCGGRFRLGIGLGWNEVEFTGLNENFHNRGRRSEEQVQVMQQLWAEPHVSFKGRWHTIEDAGINPRASRADLAAHRQMGRWLDAECVSARPERSRHFRPIAPPDRTGRPRPCPGRDRGLGIDGHRHGSRLGSRDPLLERSRRLAPLSDDDVRPPPSQAHLRP
jgi:Luciferase-like monooxygenase